jgi:vacuolar-type H+-ATPase subunit F/Vma7
MSDIGIIGSRELVDIFEILGVTVYHAENTEQARGALEKIIKEKQHKIAFVLESLATTIKEEMQIAQSLDYLTVIPLPDYRSEMSYLDDELKRLSKKAIGMEI